MALLLLVTGAVIFPSVLICLLCLFQLFIFSVLGSEKNLTLGLILFLFLLSLLKLPLHDNVSDFCAIDNFNVFGPKDPVFFKTTFLNNVTLCNENYFSYHLNFCLDKNFSVLVFPTFQSNINLNEINFKLSNSSKLFCLEFITNMKACKNTLSEPFPPFMKQKPSVLKQGGYRIEMDGNPLRDSIHFQVLYLYMVTLVYLYKKYLLWVCKKSSTHDKSKLSWKVHGKIIKLRSARLKYFFNRQFFTCLLILLLLCGDIHPNPGPLTPHHRHPKRESLVVGSWNVRTLLDNKRSHLRPTAIVSQALESHNIDICALSETRHSGEKIITELGAGGYTFFLKGVPEGDKQIHGVGIAIRSKLLGALHGQKPVGINERLMKMVLPLKRGSLHIISAYAPTASYSDAAREQFYDQLSQLLREIPATDKLLLLGDFNARVGDDYNSWEGVLGKHGVGAENQNGTALLSFCTQNELVVTNTLFQQPDRFKLTWMHPGTKKWHMIDYVITRQRDVKDVFHTRAMCGTCNWTDHRLVKSKLAIKSRKPLRHHRIKPRRKLNINKLMSPEFRQNLAEKFSEVFDNSDCLGQNSEATLCNLTRLTFQASKDVLGYAEFKSRDWFDENDQIIKPLLNDLRILKTRAEEDPTNTVLNASYHNRKQEVQNRLRAMENSWWKDRAHETQTAADKRDYKSLYQNLKAIYGPKHRKYPSVKSNDGKTLITDPSGILNRWVEHFDSVLNNPSDFDWSVLDGIPQWEVNTGLADPPTLKEVEDSVRQLTSGKAAGPDGIPPDVYKHGGSSIRKQLLKLFIQSWTEGQVPQAFKDADLMHLYKNKGDIKCCDNHRGISLLCIAGKIYARILLNRLVAHLEVIGLLPESQCGFVAGRSTIDPCFALRQLQEKCWFHSKDLFLLFVDLTKAFDTVNRDGLWALLKKIGCPDHFVSIIRSFHDGMKITVKEGTDKAAPFIVSSGTKQGCVLAPTLFSIFFSLMLFVAFKNTNEGVKICSRYDRGLLRTTNQHFKASTMTTFTVIRDLLFADDCALASSTEEGLQNLCDAFSSAARRFGLKISIDKTESMYQAPLGAEYVAPQINVEGKPLKAVKTFKYLGSIVSDNNSMEAEITARLAKANSAYNKLTTRLWRKGGIRTGTKIQVYQAAVLSTLLYGSEAWTLTRKLIRRLEKFHLTCLRKIAGIKWFHKVPNYKVLERCHINSVTSILDLNKLRWTGHVIRMDDTRIPKRMLYGRLANGSSRQGNHVTYMNGLRKTLRASNICTNDGNLEELARDRNAWRRTVKKGILKAEDDYRMGLREKYLHSRELRHARQCLP